MNLSAPLRGLGLAVGMLTALPVPAVLRVTPGVARAAMLWAPVAAVPLAAVVIGVLCGGDALGLPPLVVGFAAVGALAGASRALHLDGLSDTVDGLTASYDRERSLAVMKGGTAGPAGVAALVVVLGAQAAALATLSGDLDAALLAGAAVVASRAALWLAAASIVPAARPDGLGVSFTGSVPVVLAVLGWVAIGAVSTLVDPVGGPVTVLAAVLAVAVVLQRAVRRFGGVTGDVFGACVELALAVLLVGASALA